LLFEVGLESPGDVFTTVVVSEPSDLDSGPFVMAFEVYKAVREVAFGFH
jgi:hypothetical protein